jgi:hypothetical protein
VNAAAIRSFAAQASAERAAIFGGIPHETADGNGDNFSIPSTNAPGGLAKFRAGFVRMANRRDIEIHGFIVDCHGAVTIPDRLNLVLTLDSVLTYLPTGELFKVCELGKRTALSVEQRYALRRLES